MRAARVNLTVDGFNDQSASFQHRVTGVYNQVHYYLFDLSGVCPYSPERCVQPDYNLDVITNQTAEHFIHSGHQVVQVQHPGLKHLFAGEGQELFGQRGGTLSARGYPFQFLARRFALLELHRGDLAVAEDGRQQVIEIVCDSACQSPHRFHFLRVTQPLLALTQSLASPLAFGDIRDCRAAMGGVALGTLDRYAQQLDFQRSAGLRHELDLAEYPITASLAINQVLEEASPVTCCHIT